MPTTTRFWRTVRNIHCRSHLFAYSFVISVVIHFFLGRWIILLDAGRTWHWAPVTLTLEPTETEPKQFKPPPLTKALRQVFRTGVQKSANTSRERSSNSTVPVNPASQPEQPAAPDETGGMSGSTPPDFGGNIGGVEIPAGPGGASAGPPATGSGSASSGQRGSSSRSGRTSRQPPKSSTPSEKDSFSGAEIPGYVIDAAGHRPTDGGAIYPEVDKYVLYSPDLRMSRSVPGTDVCIDGNIMRSKDAIVIAETKTDYSKCSYFDKGDDSIPTLKCPAGALTKIVHYDSYLSSPLRYSVRACLLYDTSNCYDVQVEDTERQMCRVDFQYEGLWLEGTKFHHLCLQSEARTYEQPLRYTVRWFMEVEVQERLRRREILRETRTVPGCGSQD